MIQISITPRLSEWLKLKKILRRFPFVERWLRAIPLLFSFNLQ